MKTALDHMMGESIEPLIAVFVLLDEANPRQDLRQLDSYVEMVATELVPLVDSKYPTIATPAGRAVVGAGSAADAAMTCAFGQRRRAWRSSRRFVVPRRTASEIVQVTIFADCIWAW